MRVVVLAEGGGELGIDPLAKAPGSLLGDEELGPAHLLVGRILEGAQFESPLRTARGRRARGSQLLHARTLRQLLTWARPPDLAVVLVDEDGQDSRRRDLEDIVTSLTLPPQKVVGVAVREFESWLISHLDAVRSVLNRSIEDPGDVEAMPPGRAKALLSGWMPQGSSPEERLGLRRHLASTCDLQRLAERSRSFAHFQRDLRTVRGG